ncbi:ankyrin repeat and protein kinase domain-containing protein 1-like [Schistocerca nitens]|uniref:ankyrin repeat and protein kinase domain-containing protein 1-like n=1 Tax=Schistocerca nitens TaxID=7011 RepID=UPI002117A5CA|nr:ankyrin repeat and protein kinase domain-containing protein 1-like [Schistocerca nitens]XP_049796422.1 ankyrin repeat and protein kinase domain-containing protein 1-like [Schistocerca nitens]
MEAVKDVTETVAVDLGALLDAGDDAMVILEAGDTRLVAHRAVLADRSPVLAAMFAHDTLETSTGVVRIADVGGPVLRQLVSYLYTLRAPQLPGTAPQLLVAADKYRVSGLKAECGRQVAAQLTVETAAAAAVLAVRHSCSDLRRAAIEFIKTRTHEVMATQGWADAMLHQPKDLIEVSRLLYDPPPNSRSLSAGERDRRLVQAAELGAVGELRALIAAGADVVARGRWGRTALHWAADRGDVEAVRLLVGAGAAVDARDREGWTPLHLAAYNGRAEVADALLVAGADRGATTGDGRTALDVTWRKHRRLVEMLSGGSPSSELCAKKQELKEFVWEQYS